MNKTQQANAIESSILYAQGHARRAVDKVFADLTKDLEGTEVESIEDALRVVRVKYAEGLEKAAAEMRALADE